MSTILLSKSTKAKMELFALIYDVVSIVEDQDDPMMLTRSWSDVYDDIFSITMSERVNELLDNLLISFYYCDPDTTYEEDVRAYADALARLAEDMLGEKD